MNPAEIPQKEGPKALIQVVSSGAEISEFRVKGGLGFKVV